MPSSRLSRTLPIATAILVVAAVVRIVSFLQMRTCPLFSHPVFDARGYAAWAAEIATGTFVWDRVRIHGPGYPALLAILSRLSGHDLDVMTFANVLLGVATVGILGAAVGRRHGAVAGAAAALLLALSRLSIHFEGHLLATTWFAFLLVAAYGALAADRPRGAVRRAAVAGLLLGLAAITRPNGLAPVPFVAAWLALAPRPPDAPPGVPARRLVAPAALLAAVLAVTAPVLVLNHRASGTWTLQHNGAFNVWLGNRPGSPGYPDVRPGRDWDALVTAPAREGITTYAGHEAWFRTRILAFAREDPAAFARLQLRKLGLLLNRREVRTTLAPEFFVRFAPIQGAPFLLGFGAIGPLALLGIALAARRPRRHALELVFLGPSAALVVLTVMGSRYRAPLLPFFCAFGGVAARTIVATVRARDARRLAGLALGLAAGIAITRIPFPDLERVTYGEETARVASVYQEQGDLETAQRWWAESLREDPDRTESWVSYASLQQRRRDWPELERATREGLRASPDDWLLRMFRGRALIELGRPEDSLEALRPVLARRPADPDLLAGIARAHAGAGRADSAAVWAERAEAARAAARRGTAARAAAEPAGKAP